MFFRDFPGFSCVSGGAGIPVPGWEWGTLYGRDMLARWSLGLVLSVVAHLGVVVIGLAMGARAFSGPVDVEIAGVNLEEVKDLPLGGPEAGEGKAKAPARARNRAPHVAAEGTLASSAGK